MLGAKRDTKQRRLKHKYIFRYSLKCCLKLANMMSYKQRSHIVPEAANDVQQSSWNHHLHCKHATHSSLEYIPVHRRQSS